MKLPRDLAGTQIAKSLQRLGFTAERQKGSHVRMIKGEKCITVPMHRVVAVGTLRNILRQAGLTIEEFLEVL